MQRELDQGRARVIVRALLGAPALSLVAVALLVGGTAQAKSRARHSGVQATDVTTKGVVAASATATFAARSGYAGQLALAGGAHHHLPVSRCVSATGIRFSVIRFPPGDWAFLTVGLPASPDPDGVTTFRTHELRPGWVPSIPRGRRCSSRLRGLPSRRLPLYHG
jgi:hypothetical protein